MKADKTAGDSTVMEPLDISKLHDDSELTPEEVATWLRVTLSWVREHAAERRRPYLPGEKLGKRWTFRWGTLKEWRKGLAKRA